MNARVDGIVETALHVEDMARSMTFYDRLFGFPKMVHDDRFCAYNAGERSVFLLFKRGGTLELVRVPGGLIPPHDGSGRLHMAFAIPTDSLDAWRTRLQECGVEIESTVKWEEGGTSLYFRDPDGHAIELATPGIWENY